MKTSPTPVEPPPGAAVPTNPELDADYGRFADRLRGRIANLAGPLFETDADAGNLWLAYLEAVPPAQRQHYNCDRCRQFIQKFGGLATIGTDGEIDSPLWSGEAAAGPLTSDAASRLSLLVRAANVKGIYLPTARVWGVPQTGIWTHLSGECALPLPTDALRTAGQIMAEKREDFGMLNRALGEYPLEAAVQAVRVLEAGVLYRSEKAAAVAAWFLELHRRTAASRHPNRSNLVWLAAASAPVGFCHVKTTVISTLLDDIVAGRPFEALSERWAEKMHPLQYQRPQALPKGGAIDRAEKIFAELGLAPALRRRAATLDDVVEKLWMPRMTAGEAGSGGGVFGHLRGIVRPASGIGLPPVRITWEKFRRTILAGAVALEIRIPAHGDFCGTTTAVDAGAPPVLQWDGLEGLARNPVAWYYYHGGSPARQWNLAGNAWGSVTAVFLSPPYQQRPERFAHHAEAAHFAIADCRDTRSPGLCLFPENLRSELREIRSVIEAHSKSAKLQGQEAGTANGLTVQNRRECPRTGRSPPRGGESA